MNAEDEKKLRLIQASMRIDDGAFLNLIEAFALGRARGMTEAAGILKSVNNYDNPMTANDCAAAIEKARDA